MVINGAIVSDLDMMYIESVLQVKRKRFVGSLFRNESTFLPRNWPSGSGRFIICNISEFGKRFNSNKFLLK